MASIRTWYRWHKWTSLVCTLFLLLLCVTGLPLIFRDEIGHWLDAALPYADVPPDTLRVSLDSIVAAAQQRYPVEAVRFLFIDDDEPRVVVTMAPTVDADNALNHALEFDARTGEMRREDPPEAKAPMTFIGLMFSLHADLFAGLPGELFVGFMGLLFVIAIVSGVVLYSPFMKKLDFGTVRTQRGRRLKWLDLHNLLGIVTLAWVFVVGVTGVMNELSTPLFGLWRITDVKTMLASYEGKPVPTHLSSAQAAYDTASAALPGMTIISMVFPQKAVGSPHHYLIWTKGATALTSRLFTPALIDAQTGQLSAIAPMPWYLRALEVSRPLHFGDYGGLPLKILWTVFDLVTVVVLISGLYLWQARRRTVESRIAVFENEHPAAAMAAPHP